MTCVYKKSIVFVFSTGIAAIFYIFPALFPFFAPIEWA
jgi:hypothetical protein